MPAVTGHIEGTGRLDRHGGGSGSGAVMTSYLPSSSTQGCRRHGGSISSPAEAPLFFLRQPTSTRAVHHLTRRMEGHYQPRASVLVRPASPQFYTFNDPGGRGERCASASPGQVGSRGGARWIGRRDAGEANQKAEGQCRNARPQRTPPSFRFNFIRPVCLVFGWDGWWSVWWWWCVSCWLFVFLPDGPSVGSSRRGCIAAQQRLPCDGGVWRVWFPQPLLVRDAASRFLESPTSLGRLLLSFGADEGRTCAHSTCCEAPAPLCVLKSTGL